MAEPKEQPIGPKEARGWIAGAIVSILGLGTVQGFQSFGARPDGVVEVQLRTIGVQLDRMEAEQTKANDSMVSSISRLSDKTHDLDVRMSRLETAWSSDSSRREEMAKAIEELRQQVALFKARP